MAVNHEDLPTLIARAAGILRAGGIVAFPTETVYGLGAHAFDERAVARVFEAKGRPWFDPLIVHVASVGEVGRVAAEFGPLAQSLFERFAPGPLTLVLPKRPEVSDLVTAGLPSVAVRIPDHPIAQALLRAADFPICAPSANRFGRISPTTAPHVTEQLAGAIDLVLDGGPCRVGVESTVLALTGDKPVLLRPGGVTLEEIEEAIGPVARETPGAAPLSAGAAAPGMLPAHYAPRTPLVVIRAELLLATLSSTGNWPAETAARTGILAFQQAPANAERFAAVEVLSPAGDLREAAARFFAALRRLDAAGLAQIMAEPFPDVGLGRALNDRLSRAAHSGFAPSGLPSIM
jgi:L-threonylcarbamoyladenylate synthase